MHFIFRMHAHAPYGASRSAESIQVCLFPRRKAGELRSSLPRGRAPLKVDGHAIQSLFDRPQGEAAKQLGISITAMKQVCRKLDIVRWPYRRKKKAESARAAHTSLAAARKASAVEACSSVCASVDAFEPAHTPRSVVSSASSAQIPPREWTASRRPAKTVAVLLASLLSARRQVLRGTAARTYASQPTACAVTWPISIWRRLRNMRPWTSFVCRRLALHARSRSLRGRTRTGFLRHATTSGPQWRITRPAHEQERPTT